MDEQILQLNIFLLVTVLIAGIYITYNSYVKQGLKGALDNIGFGVVCLLGIVIASKLLPVPFVFVIGYFTIIILLIIANSIIFFVGKEH